MNIFFDYTLTCGTSEGRAVLQNGDDIWYCLHCNPHDPRLWQFGIANSPRTDILSEMQSKHSDLCYCESGVFASEMSEQALNKFIEMQLEAFSKLRG